MGKSTTCLTIRCFSHEECFGLIDTNFFVRLILSNLPYSEIYSLIRYRDKKNRKDGTPCSNSRGGEGTVAEIG